MASGVTRNYGYKPPATDTPSPSPLDQFGNPGSFTAAAKTQASDYDKIMAQYDQLVQSSLSNPLTPSIVNQRDVANQGGIASAFVNFNPASFSSINPQTSQYSQSGDVTRSLAGLSDLATTGGYSEADKQNIRERDISPIRSIYANAQQNAERQRALGGGYSPNFNATQAQMARDEANKIGDITTAANAGIAQNVAANRLSAAPNYASASAAANAAQTEADRHNADIINQINQFNSQGTTQNQQFNSQGQLQAGIANASNSLSANEFNTSLANAIATGNANRATSTDQFNSNAALQAQMANRGNIFGALQGKTSLYGTTPALVNTFGNQVGQAAGINQNQQQLNNNQFGQILASSNGGRYQY